MNCAGFAPHPARAYLKYTLILTKVKGQFLQSPKNIFKLGLDFSKTSGILKVQYTLARQHVH